MLTIESHERLIELADAHQRADEYEAGHYEWNGKACAIGCAIHDAKKIGLLPEDIDDDDHAALAEYTGVGEWLWHLADSIFEGLPAGKKPSWLPRLLRAIKPGVDYSVVRHRLAFWLLAESDLLTINGINREAINTVARLHRRSAEGDAPSEKEWSVAESAARSAESAAQSAESAALSAAQSAESAAQSAESAALSARSVRSAVWSARSAARSARSAALSAESAARSAESAALSARSAARSAVWSAESAAQSVVWSALSAESAAESAALSAESAAESAALSAARSALSAAQSAEWVLTRVAAFGMIADKIIELMEARNDE